MNPPNTAPPWLLPAILIGFPILFAALWSFVCWLLSILGGWSRMAERFATTEPPSGQRFAGQTGRAGLSNDNSVLTIHVSPSGLRLDVFPLFRIGHKPLLIPWPEIHEARTHTNFRKQSDAPAARRAERKLAPGATRGY